MKVFTENLILGAGLVGRMIGVLVSGMASSTLLESKSKDVSLNAFMGAQYLHEPVPVFSTRRKQIITTVDGLKATPESIQKYKEKIGKRENAEDCLEQFKLLTWGYEVLKVPDEGLHICYDSLIKHIDLEGGIVYTEKGMYVYRRLISTLPFTVFNSLTDNPDWKKKEIFLRHSPIYVRTQHDSDRSNLSVFFVDYVSDPKSKHYRVTRRNGEMHFEYLEEVPESRAIFPGKIYAFAEELSEIGKFQMELRKRFNVYHFGRWATWRPDELAHQTYHEAKEVIQTWKN